MLDPAAAARSSPACSGVDAGRSARQAVRAARASSGSSATSPRPSSARCVRLGLPGIGFRTERHRVYPQRALTAHLVGYVGVENQGLAGIERSFEDRLTGAGAAQAPLALTIDLGVQEVVRSELAACASRAFAPRAAPALVLDVATGELLAMVSLPDFDPNRYQQAIARGALQPQHAQGTYELGSLFKLFTVAMALDAGVVDIDDGYDASRAAAVRPLSDQRLPRQAALAQRARGDRVLVQHRRRQDGRTALGAEGQRAYFERFGLLERHPIRLPEVGQPQRPAPWRPINTVTAAYGHGIAVSPLQVADAVAGDGLRRAAAARPPGRRGRVPRGRRSRRCRPRPRPSCAG